MRNQNDTDISNIQVPNSFIQEILSETKPLEESREEVHPSQPQAAQISEQGEITKLLSLMFEEFDKINERLDSLQGKINEMTGVGSLGAGYSKTQRPRYSKSPECDAQAELEGKRSSLTKLLQQRLAR